MARPGGERAELDESRHVVRVGASEALARRRAAVGALLTGGTKSGR